MAIAVLAIASMAVAGCGSSSKSSASSSTSTTAITKAEFLAKGNAICIKNQARNKAAQAKFGNHPTKAQFTSYINTTLLPGIQNSINAIKALGAPPGDQATITKMLNLAQADVNKIKANPTSLLTSKTNPFTNFANVAHPYGLKECAKNA
jgi:ABC-type glycerol-3-phosphate transport system substrate-binding protein